MIGHGVPGLSIRQEHDFPAHGAAIFDALTLGIDAWWPAEARVCGQGGRLTLAPELGAALVEQGAGGAAAIWGVVDAIEPARRLYLNGWFGVAGVVSGRVHFDLDETAEGTRLTLLHQAIGPVPEDLNTQFRARWRRILDSALRKHLTLTTV